jgi:hypothetical protein
VSFSNNPGIDNPLATIVPLKKPLLAAVVPFKGLTRGFEVTLLDITISIY